MRILIKMKHKFHSKDVEDGSWMVWCPVTRGSFSTKLWKQGVIATQECACCGEDVKKEINVKSEEQLRQELKFSNVRYGAFQRLLDIYKDGAK